MNESGIHMSEGKIWISEEADKLQLRIMITAHCGYSEHRGLDSTGSTVRETYNRNTIDEAEESFVSQCIHFIMCKSGEKTPRPFSLTLHPTKRKEM